MSIFANAKHCGMAPRSCSLRAWLVEITVYSTRSQTFNVPSTEAVAKRSFCPWSKATLSTLAVWDSEMTMYCSVDRLTRVTVPTLVVARI